MLKFVTPSPEAIAKMSAVLLATVTDDTKIYNAADSHYDSSAFRARMADYARKVRGVAAAKRLSK